MFNWLRSAFSRGRAALEMDRISARVDQLELEWHDTLDKLRAREERERKRKRSDVAAAASAGCIDCGPETPVAAAGTDPMKLDMWQAMKAARETRGRPQ